jgi:WD40 repeat protein
MALAPESILHGTYRIAQVADGRPDGAVYRATTSDGRRVLIGAQPQIGADERDELRTLAQQIAALPSASGLLPLRDHFAEGGDYYLVCDDPGGAELDRYVRDRGGPLPQAVALAQMERLLRALEALHSARPPLFLGDLRSTDVWSDQQGDLSLAPFALLRPVSAQEAGYRAPELSHHDAEPNGPADMYSFGALLYQLLTGWLPPPAAQRAAGTPLNAPRSLNARISPLAEQAALRALELKPANRYQVPREMRQALEAVGLMGSGSLGLEGAPIEAPQAPPPSFVAQPGPPPPAAQTGAAGFPAPPQVVSAPTGAQPAYGQPAPSGYNQPWAQQPAPAPRQRGSGCLIAIAVLLGLVVLLLAIALTLVLLRPGLLGALGIAPAATVIAPTSAAEAPAADATEPTADATAAPEATSRPANPNAISLANAAQLTQTQVFTESLIGPVLFSPDGGTLAVSDGDTITLRDATALDNTRAVLRGHTGGLNTLTFSADSALLASGAIEDQTIRVWDVQSGALERTIEGHAGWIRSLAFSPDGALLASGSTDKTIRLWNPADGSLVRTLEGHTDFVTRVAFAPDGKTLASTSRDGTVRLWDVATGQQKPEWSFTAPTMGSEAPDESYVDKPFWMTGLSFSPDGALLAAGSTDGQVRVWELPAGTLVQTLVGHRSWVMPNMLDFTPDGKTLVSGSRDGTVRLWDPRTGAERSQLRTPGLMIGVLEFTSLDVSPDGATIATSSDESGLVVLWSAETGDPNASLALGQGVAQSLAATPDGRLLVSSGVNGVLQLIDPASGERGTLPIVAPVHQGMAFLGSDRLAIVTPRATVVLLDLKEQGTFTELEGLTTPAFCVVASRDGKLLAAGSSEGKIVIWDAATLDVKQTLTVDVPANVGTLAFSDDGKQLAVATVSDSADVTLFDLASGDAAQTLSGHTNMVLSIAFQPNGLTVATASADGTLRLWERAKGEQLASLEAQPGEGYYTSVAFSPDGGLLVAGSIGGSVSLRSPINGETTGFLGPVGEGVLSLVFSADGEQLAIGCRDGSVRLLDAQQ